VKRGEVEKEILEFIEKRNKEYNKKSQRAALLSRHKKFCEELKQISNRLGKDFLEKTKDLERMMKKRIYPSYPRSFWEKNEEWSVFCDRWHIDPDWNGEIDSLEKYTGKPVEITIQPKFESSTKVFLLLKVDSWTTLDDIRQVWPKVEKYQKKYLYQKIEKKTTFGRDLCWYDLNKKHGLSYKEIANLWNNKYQEDIDLLIIRRIKKDKIVMDQIEDAKKRDDKLKELIGRVLDDQEFLKEIKSGKLSEKFKYALNDEREFYLTGKTNRGKMTPPIDDLIKAAIKRIEKYINKMELGEEFYYKQFGEHDEPFKLFAD
jgi:hypothetical protein